MGLVQGDLEHARHDLHAAGATLRGREDEGRPFRASPQCGRHFLGDPASGGRPVAFEDQHGSVGAIA